MTKKQNKKFARKKATRLRSYTVTKDAMRAPQRRYGEGVAK